jgi:N-acetylmuramic acid 6-phosphate (MurNAc-6-P) etherase
MIRFLRRILFLFLFVTAAIASGGMDSNISYAELDAKYNHLRHTTTEQQNEDTKFLSQTFQQNPNKGIDLLLRVDEGISAGIGTYKDTYAEAVTASVYEAITNGRQAVAIGAGSSGRLTVDAACKWREAIEKFTCSEDEGLEARVKSSKVRGAVAGGKVPFVRPKERVEDSQEEGEKQITELGIGEGDVVLLISASGNAPFNVGAAKEAHKRRAKVYYFYNSEKASELTEGIFQDGIATPLKIIIGAQAIQGSTRLQAATLAWLCWGGTLESVYRQLVNKTPSHNQVFERLIANYNEGMQRIRAQIPLIAELAKKTADLQSVSGSNFFTLEDTFSETTPGYTTFLTSGNTEDKGLDMTASRIAVVETAELPPTFGVPRPPFQDEVNAKDCFFRCYQVLDPDKTNIDAWNLLNGEKAAEEEIDELNRLTLASHVPGHGSYAERPKKGPGNQVWAFMMGNPNEKSRNDLLKELASVKAQGGQTAFFGVLTDEAKSEAWKQAIVDAGVDTQFFLDGAFEEDEFGLSRTMMTKVFGNLYTNSTMINLGKVYGNIMIDLNVSNYKLWFRALGIIQAYLDDHGIEGTEKDIFEKTKEVLAVRKIQMEAGLFFPPVVRVTNIMLKEKCSVQEAVGIISENPTAGSWVVAS